MALTLISQCEDDIDYSVDNIILFTWNPNNKKVCGDSDSKLKWNTMILRHLKHLTRCSRKFCMVAELSPTGRLHCHGWFSMDDKYKWNKSVYPHFYTYGNVKHCKMRSAKALWYYKKDVEQTVLDTSIDAIVYCHRNATQLLKSIKKNIENDQLSKARVHRSKSLLDYLDFAGFEDTPDLAVQ